MPCPDPPRGGCSRPSGRSFHPPLTFLWHHILPRLELARQHLKALLLLPKLQRNWPSAASTALSFPAGGGDPALAGCLCGWLAALKAVKSTLVSAGTALTWQLLTTLPFSHDNHQGQMAQGLGRLTHRVALGMQAPNPPRVHSCQAANLHSNT